MVSLRSLALILALYGLGTQAAPAQEEQAVEHHDGKVSILDLARNGKVTDSGTVNVTYKHELPEPNRYDTFEVDGITFYSFPGGADVHPEFWEERNISFPDTANSSSLEARQSYITSCEPCKCSFNQQVWYEWQTQNWNTVVGNTHLLSDPLCPPGSISKSWTKSWSHQISVQAGPDLKIGAGILEKFGIRAGYSYTWWHAEATQYGVSWNKDGQQHPFVATFHPNIFVVNGIARAHYVDHYYNNMACGVSDWSHMNLHLPLVEQTNNDCLKETSTCGAAGSYDSCFYIGKYAKKLCPGRNLGPTPVGRECPNYLYPAPFNNPANN
ncbi:hypothetical protein CNMCM6936_006829 [Aspergillus lentulus]|nr:hypothetical protein CNMCM6936_006829 [Aspergillus lentulus]